MASIATDYTWWKTKNPFAFKLHTYKPAVLHFSENPSSSHPSAHGSKTTRYIEGIGAALASSHFFSCELQERNTRERLFASNITRRFFFRSTFRHLPFHWLFHTEADRKLPEKLSNTNINILLPFFSGGKQYSPQKKQTLHTTFIFDVLFIYCDTYVWTLNNNLQFFITYVFVQ